MALRYYKLGETPAYYITAWYKLLSGKWEVGKVHATETTVEGVTVELTTADGSEYGLHHVTNIWRGTELGFNTDEPYLASIIGKTVTQITYYLHCLPLSSILLSWVFFHWFLQFPAFYTSSKL